MSKPRPLRPRIIAPPPVLYLGAFLLGFALDAIVPIELLPTASVQRVLGGLFVVLSGILARWAFLTLRRLGTTANPYKPSEALASDGPFHFSRNPIYVAMTGLYVGLALLANSTWPLLLLVPLLFLMHWGVVRREENYLVEKFGDVYTEYRSKVRRWL